MSKIEKILYNNCGKKNKFSRDNWLIKKLQELKPDSSILDAGAGELRCKKFCKHLKYVSHDFAQYNGTGDNIGIQIGKWDNSKLDIVSDIVSIPVENSSFDAVLCVEVFEHIPEPHKAIAEFSRILKKEGILILTVPVCSQTHFAPYYFYNGFSKYYFDKFLIENGFEIVELSYNGNYFEFLAQELHRLIYMSSKYAKISGIIFKLLIRILTLLLFLILNYLSKKDNSSNEVLSFGIHVVAKKK